MSETDHWTPAVASTTTAAARRLASFLEDELERLPAAHPLRSAYCERIKRLRRVGGPQAVRAAR
jgi:hypothetical protein